MPSSQTAATERRNNDRTITHEPPKLKTTLKTPPKQATNPLQFVKVGPCSLYRTAQEQLQKVQEVKKIKQEIRDDPEDWQSNLDNWKSSRRKRQEHIIERVVEVKKLELEEHDRQRRRSKTFSEMMEERGSRGRKLSISLAMYSEEDANDLSDLGIGTSSGKSSVSGDTHDDAHSVLSDRDSEIDKNHSDVDNGGGHHVNGNEGSTCQDAVVTSLGPALKKDSLDNGFHKGLLAAAKRNGLHEYDSGTTATASSPEPEEYTYEGAIRGYVSRVAQNIPRRSLASLDAKLERVTSNGSSPSLVKVDVLKRREIFERALRDPGDAKNNNGSASSSNSSIGSVGIGNNNGVRPELECAKSIKERLSCLERQKSDLVEKGRVARISLEGTIALKERLYPRAKPEKELKLRDFVAEELEDVKPLRERLSSLEKLVAPCDQGFTTSQFNGELKIPKSIKDRFVSLDADKRPPSCFHEQVNSRAKNLTPSERSSSPDSEYRVPRGATFHQSLDSLDADTSSGPDTFERVQSLEELDYHQARRYPASSSSAEVLNDTDREDSGIHTADASCSVSQADEPIEEEAGGSASEKLMQLKQQQQLPHLLLEEKTAEFRSSIETSLAETSKNLERIEEKIKGLTLELKPRDAVLMDTGTADNSSSSSTSEEPLAQSANQSKTEPRSTNTNMPRTYASSSRPIVYQSPRLPARWSPANVLEKPSHLAGLFAGLPDQPEVASPSPSSPKSPSPPEPSVQVFGVQTPPSPVPRSPLASPRSFSKIPTPLPRKMVASPTTPEAHVKFPAPPQSPKQRNFLPSEIPVPIKPLVVSPGVPKVLPSPEARRRSVVEVCEKVVVPRGQARVTPFIIVERYPDETNGSTDEVRTDEQLSTAYKS